MPSINIPPSSDSEQQSFDFCETGLDSRMEKVESRNERPVSQGEPDANVLREDGGAKPQGKKHYSFYLSILMLAMIALIVAWDVTALSLALPVSPSPRRCYNIRNNSG